MTTPREALSNLIPSQRMQDDILTALAPFFQQWEPIENAPKGKLLLVGYTNSLGIWRTVRGRYYTENTLQDHDESDKEFADPGWYEETEAYEYLSPLEHPPTHFMRLPPKPKETQ